ncbi:MAG TPA: FlgO family outer membrane protein, partial [Gemmatimonadales bacterium]|nr:FlgO family outer membrane protein [Gemmatimonadales bacterium]
EGRALDPRPSTFLYYVMPYVEGETLKDRLAREGQLAPAVVTRLVGEIGAALDYAPRHGIIHRDIKPANILLHEGTALLADFGIARVASSSDGERLTETGLSIGTPQYMSPEQAAGEREIGPASDQYSLAVVAYEALAGRLPFVGPTLQALLVQMFTSAPTPLTASRPELPEVLNAAVLRGMNRDPGQRFADCETFAQALRDGTNSTASPTAIVSPPRKSRRWRAPVLVAAVLALGGIGGWFALGRPGGGASSAPRLLAVLPFVNLTGDTAREYFGRGLAVEITDELHRLGIEVVGSAASAAAARQFVAGRDVDVLAAGRSVGADAVLGGTLIRSTAGGRVKVELTDVRSKRLLWTDDYTLGADLFAMQDSVARRVAGALRVTLLPADIAAVQRGRGVDLAAHDQVVRAKGYADRRDPAGLDQAIPLFSDAIRRDSTYAEAWAGLAEAYFLRAVFSDAGFGNVVDHSDYFRRSAVAAERALTLDSTSAAVHRVLGMLAVFHTHDWAAAQREFERAVALDSAQAATWLFRTWYYYGMGQRDSALWSVRRAWALDSLTPIYATRLADVLRDQGNGAEAHRLLGRTVQRNRTDLIPRISYAATLAAAGQCDSALKLPVPSLRSSPGAQQQLEVWARCGRNDLVRGSLDSADAAVRRGEWAHGIFMAMGAAMIADTARMERWLDYSVTARDYTAFFLRAPAFAGYQSNPHYRAALAGFGLE